MRIVGISEEIVNFFAEFLMGRTFIHSSAAMQLNSPDEVYSAPSYSIKRGVLQGSISGPIPFILFIDDILRKIDGSIAYADDLVIASGNSDVTKLQSDTQKAFRRLEQMTKDLGLEINMDKSKVMIFRDGLNTYAVKKKMEISGFKIKNRAGVRLEMVETYRYLGVTLDKFLK